MPIETRVTFRNCTPSPTLEADIRRRVDKLARFHERILRCAVAVELPHRRHRGGNWFHVRIELSLPGEDVVINHEPKRMTPSRYGDLEAAARLVEPDAVGLHARVAVREAFQAARRRLREHAQRLQRTVHAGGGTRRRAAGALSA